MFLIGGLVPLIVSVIATFSKADLPITATPLSFGVTILFNGIAISQLHLLDIQPIATQRILNWITDCYLILSDKGLVIGYNKPFEEVFAAPYGITENRYLSDFAKEEDVANRTPIYNMISAVDSSREMRSVISYEQALTVTANGTARKNYYIIDVTPLVIENNLSGVVVIFKDITQLKKSMQQLQDSRERMMEQERFAFLGQMMGGLAHNLKTPIMSIAGCISAAESLIDECLDSLEDPAVNSDDYREIYGEIRDWFGKVQESTAYMSDIITAIKGQANSGSAYQDAGFKVDELIKRTALLMRHELSSGGCTLDVKINPQLGDLAFRGDINNLIQVLNNLLSNAIYSQKQVGGGVITLEIDKDEANLIIRVRDRGTGVSKKIRDRLFKEMVTSKGSMGSGLGLYISNTVVRGKFNGSMWMEDNPGGGAVFYVSIPLEMSAMPESEL
jgi:signal transduction histidine kinase